jgi:hypothetical protein
MQPPTLHTPLQPEALYATCDPASLGFVSTESLADLDAALLQPRAIEAMHLGLDIKHKGYNLFVIGDTGSGRHAIINQLLEAERKSGEPPADWCYVNNFAAASRPRLLRLPCGRGARLRDDMQRFVGELGPAIAAAFESDDYRRRIESMQEEEKQREETALRHLGHSTAEQGVALLHTPQGFVFAPLKNGEETLSSEEFAQLPEERQEELGRLMEDFHEQLHRLISEFPHWRRETQNLVK